MNKKVQFRQYALSVCLCLLTIAAHAGEVCWPEGEEPNILVQWWVNKARMNAAFWPAVITVCVVTIGLVGFLIRWRRYKRSMSDMKDKGNALTST